MICDDEWFDIQQVKPDLFVFRESRHYEQSVASLIVGRKRSILIDTGCGIGDLRTAVEAVTDRPVVVVNTHTHSDHIGGNHQFDDIAMFDHPVSRKISENGVAHHDLEVDILADNLIVGPWPEDFNPEAFSLPPFDVTRWLADGDLIDAGGRELQLIHTPGEAMNHICLLDRTERLLFCEDILLRGAIWTHLEGGCLSDLMASYRRLMRLYHEFDHLMPGHNDTWIEKSILPH